MTDPGELFTRVADGLVEARARIDAIDDERSRAELSRRLAAVSSAAKRDLHAGWRRLVRLLAELEPASGDRSPECDADDSPPTGQNPAG